MLHLTCSVSMARCQAGGPLMSRLVDVRIRGTPVRLFSSLASFSSESAPDRPRLRPNHL